MAFKNEYLTEEEKKEIKEMMIGYTPDSGGKYGAHMYYPSWWAVDRERNLKFFHTFYNRDDSTDEFFALLTSESEKPIYIEMRRTWEDEVMIWKLEGLFLPEDLRKKADAMTKEEKHKYCGYWLDIMKEALVVYGYGGNPEDDYSDFEVKFDY